MGFKPGVKYEPSTWIPDLEGAGPGEAGAVHVWVFERKLSVDITRSQPFRTIAALIAFAALVVLVAAIIAASVFPWGGGLGTPLVILFIFLLLPAALLWGYGTVYRSEIVIAGWRSPGGPDRSSADGFVRITIHIAGASAVSANVGGKSTAHREIKELFDTPVTAQAVDALFARLKISISD